MKLADAPERARSTTWKLTGAPSLGIDAVVARPIWDVPIKHSEGDAVAHQVWALRDIPLPISASGLGLDAQFIDTLIAAAWRPVSPADTPDDLAEVTFDSMPTTVRRLRGRIVRRPA